MFYGLDCFLSSISIFGWERNNSIQDYKPSIYFSDLLYIINDAEEAERTGGVYKDSSVK